MKKILIALALLATPAFADDKGVVLEDSRLLGCEDPYDAARLYTLMGQDDRDATVAWYEPKAKAGVCGPIAKGRYFIMENARHQGRVYSCIRPEGKQYCIWTMDLRGL